MFALVHASKNTVSSRLAYYSSDDEHPDDHHQSVEITPPSCIFVLCLVHGRKPVLEVLCYRRGSLRTSCTFALFAHCGMRRERKDCGYEPGFEGSVSAKSLCHLALGITYLGER
jgi:hypothetical protein